MKAKILFSVCLFLALGLGGCLTPSNYDLKALKDKANQTGPGPDLSAPAGAKAVKIIFRATSPTGSFDSPSSSGTVPNPGSGHQVSRLFNADGTLLATGTGDSNWPAWISTIEIGVSGSSNSAATDSNCARFATAAADGVAVCDFNLDGTSDVPCGAPTGYYRVSEKDCSSGTISDGTGGPADGIYVRVNLNRIASVLAEHENLLMVLEYGVGALSSAPQEPTLCFKNGIYDPTAPGCSDMVWQLFLKRDKGESVSPFYTLIPPTLGTASTANNQSGFGVQTKDVILPISQNQNLQTIQLSRIKAVSSGSNATFNTACKNNSALCMGVVLHSLTLFRI